MLQTISRNQVTETRSQRIDSSVQYLKGVGPKRATVLAKLGIHTIEDLLYYIPTRYIDRSDVRQIRSVRIGEEATIAGVIKSIKPQRRHWRPLEATIADDSGYINSVWFGRTFLDRIISPGDNIIISGKIKKYQYSAFLQIEPKEYEIIPDDDYQPIHTAGIVPVYQRTDGLYLKSLRRLIWNVIQSYAGTIKEHLPQDILLKRKFIPLGEAIKNIHFPVNLEIIDEARKRLAYDEFFILQLSFALHRRRVVLKRAGVKLNIADQLDLRIRQRFPFALTNAQKKVIDEIRKDLCKVSPMSRLLQGDVGSGKTIVATYALLATVGNNAQSAIMAPTELLAQQHFNTISQMLKDTKVRIALLISGISAKERKKTLQEISEGKIDIVIGTHALIQKDVRFAKLALVVIDEQHRFGVRQRARLISKGRSPHMLVMTATPIPRTLSFTLFGDLDISVIDEMPPNRKPVRTIFRPTQKLQDAFTFIKNKVKEGRQVYFAYPLIDESDKLQLKSATKMFEILSSEFAGYKVELLHSRVPKAKQDEIMHNFREGKIKVLVSTIIIEVGIDVPNATIMVIENAERYGLAQLHQLRGRICRGTESGYCFLFGNPKSEIARERLKVITATNDGFKIAEDDLRLRGPGEILGTRQSGFFPFRAADPIKDLQLLTKARSDAFDYVSRDPYISKLPALRDKINKTFSGKIGIISVS